MAFGTTDTIVASRYSNDAVAALSVGSAIFISVYASLMGIFQALLPLWSEQRRRSAQAIGHSLRQSMYLCALACVLGMAVLLMPDALLRWTDVPDALQLEVKRYLAVLAWGLPPALLFRIYSALNQALGHPKLVTWLQLISLLIKIPLSIWFTFGGLGLPPGSSGLRTGHAAGQLHHVCRGPVADAHSGFLCSAGALAEAGAP
jgi:MATE family multidrug resistance protein